MTKQDQSRTIKLLLYNIVRLHIQFQEYNMNTYVFI